MFRGAEQSGELLCTNRPSKDRIYRVSHHKGLLRSDISDGFTRLRCEKFTVLLYFISNVDLPLHEGLIGYFPSRFRSAPVLLYALYKHCCATTLAESGVEPDPLGHEPSNLPIVYSAIKEQLSKLFL